jgi:hypothetical protein
LAAAAWRRVWRWGQRGGLGGVLGSGDDEEGVAVLAAGKRRRRAWRCAHWQGGGGWFGVGSDEEEEGVDAGMRRRAWWRDGGR